MYHHPLTPCKKTPLPHDINAPTRQLISPPSLSVGVNGQHELNHEPEQQHENRHKWHTSIPTMAIMMCYVDAGGLHHLHDLSNLAALHHNVNWHLHCRCEVSWRSSCTWVNVKTLQILFTIQLHNTTYIVCLSTSLLVACKSWETGKKKKIPFLDENIPYLEGRRGGRV